MRSILVGLVVLIETSGAGGGRVVAGDESSHAVHFRSGTLREPQSTQAVPPRQSPNESDFEGSGALVVRFDRPIEAKDREELERLGLHVAASIGADAVLAWADTTGTLRFARALKGVTWIAPYPPSLRLAPEVAAVTAQDQRAVVPITLHLFARSDLRKVRERLARLGLEVRGSFEGTRARSGDSDRPARLVLTPPPAQLVEVRAEIARWPETLWVGLRPYYRLHNDSAAWVGQSGLSAGQTTPVFDRGLYGEGQVVGILDTGIDADACFFRDPVLGLPPTVVGFGAGSPNPAQRKVRVVDFLWSSESPASVNQWDTQNHGTHVAGTVAGDNLATPGLRDPADGMAPRAQLVIQDGGYGVDNCADLPAIGCPAADLTPFFLQAYQQGARIHSNSWGDRENFTPFNIYSDGSEDADAFSWSHPDFLLVFAAGNNGSASSVGSPATAKNVLSVGATEHAAAAALLASFSSRGPTADGRIKPDVTAPGVDVVSARNDFNVTTNNCSTFTSSGTSMACPTVAGLAALTREYFERGFYPSGAAAPGDAMMPSAALVKAALILSAAPMEGLPTPPPSMEQGWGRVLLDDALYFAGDARRLFVRDLATRFVSPADPADAYSLQVLDGSQPLRVVLVWTDYPSTAAAATNLVNDLDLTVESPGGAIYRGNVFAGGVSQVGGAADRVNNVEVVRVDNPSQGTWTVRVAPFAVPQPSQGYALTASGRFPAPGVILERTSLALDDSVGGDADGVLEPGEWVDLPLGLLNSGSGTATNVRVHATSLSAYVDVITPEVALPDLPGAASQSTGPAQLRIHLRTTLPCVAPIQVRFDYLSNEASSVATETLPTGSESVFLSDDFEGATTWAHVTAESTATAGAWIVGDPVGTGFQPENDATTAPGVRCLYTAANPGGAQGTDDVDGGVVAARSGTYDLSGHPQARVRLSRWFANRDLGEDAGDFFRLHIRASAAGPDVLLEELGTGVSAAAWTAVTFRVADFITPGPAVSLRVAAADGTATGNLIEAAIDELQFWDPACDVHDPPPNEVLPLLANRAGDDVELSWVRPVVDPAHGETSVYRLYRSTSPAGGFALIESISDPAAAVTAADGGAATDSTGLYVYRVVAENAAGQAGP